MEFFRAVFTRAETGGSPPMYFSGAAVIAKLASELLVHFFVFWLAGFPVLVSAETISAIATTLASHSGYWSAPNSTYAGCTQRFYSSLQNACNASRCAYPGVTGWASFTITDAYHDYDYCIAAAGSQPWEGWALALAKDIRCYPDGHINDGSCIEYSCQGGQNWTLSGAFCTRPDCVLPQTRDAKGICVACPVSDLPPITDPDVQAFENNPNLSDTARLTPRMQTALSCLLTAAAAGSPKVGSAYRPPAYNQHLIDVWEKWVNQLVENANPACANLKAKIQQHFQRHRLLESQPPVLNSRHTQGLAVDVTINLPSANIDALARGCGLRRPLPIQDRVHFQFP